MRKEDTATYYDAAMQSREGVGINRAQRKGNGVNDIGNNGEELVGKRTQNQRDNDNYET